MRRTTVHSSIASLSGWFVISNTFLRWCAYPPAVLFHFPPIFPLQSRGGRNNKMAPWPKKVHNFKRCRGKILWHDLHDVNKHKFRGIPYEAGLSGAILRFVLCLVLLRCNGDMLRPSQACMLPIFTLSGHPFPQSGTSNSLYSIPMAHI